MRRVAVFLAVASAWPMGAAVAQSNGPEIRPVVLPGNGSGRVRGFPGEIRPERLPAVSASCTLTFDVSHEGRVEPASVVADCTDDDYVETALAMARSWTYEPLIVDGEAQAQVGLTAELRFREAG